MRAAALSIRRWLRNPVVLVALAAGLIAFSVQPGDVGSADTTHRLQSTHSFWTDQPPVFPDEYPEFGIHGRDGSLQSWYGIGQSLLMLPFDMVGTWVENHAIFASYDGHDPSVREIVVTYNVNILISILTALICFRLLRQFLFSVPQAAVGALALLVLTTHLHYTQNMMENNYIGLLTLAGFSWQFEWLRTGSRRALWIGSSAFGLNLLTRLTTGMDLLAGALFIALLLWFEGVRGAALWSRAKSYIAGCLPAYAFFGLMDRLYQYHRFGSFFNTYISVVAREARQRDPALPANYPWETPFHVGFFGALFQPEKSIFLFDPLLILMILLAVVAWRRFSPAVRAYTITSALMLLGYICFYARYTVWSGDTAWGDRYVSTAAELATLLAVPLLLKLRPALPRAVWLAGIGIIAASAVIQVASVAFWCQLERDQMETLGHPTFVILLRLKNMVAFALGKMQAWGLDTPSMHEDPWDYVHYTTWNLLPFELRRAGFAPMWVFRLTLAMWWAGLAALAWVLLQLRSVLGHTGEENSSAATAIRH
ncbi:MAG: hypothetical protein ACLGRW_05735 [Acidobacteriota bacterium]